MYNRRDVSALIYKCDGLCAYTSHIADTTLQTSKFVTDFKNFADSRFYLSVILDDSFLQKLSDMRTKYRNTAAHPLQVGNLNLYILSQILLSR